ncbi:Mlo-related protein [Dillenia turbinata]|uniref:Mlo-related protein n=1 Tax=Dillenia turbinata TaxID=194707 RepID=A0AAN8UQN3_9MAGN
MVHPTAIRHQRVDALGIHFSSADSIPNSHGSNLHSRRCCFSYASIPCKPENNSSNRPETSAHFTTTGRRPLSGDTGSQKCSHEAMVPLLSIEALHQLHSFIFVLAVLHVIFCHYYASWSS